MKKDRILIDSEVINKIKNGLSLIKVITKEKDVRKETQILLEIIEKELNISSLSLEERILKKMKETKNVDPEMNANLYILHRKLVNGQVTEREALELFEMYVKLEPYDRMI